MRHILVPLSLSWSKVSAYYTARDQWVGILTSSFWGTKAYIKSNPLKLWCCLAHYKESIKTELCTGMYTQFLNWKLGCWSAKQSAMGNGHFG